MSCDQVSDHMVHNFKIKVVLKSKKEQASRQADRQTCQHHMYAVLMTYSF